MEDFYSFVYEYFALCIKNPDYSRIPYSESDSWNRWYSQKDVLLNNSVSIYRYANVLTGILLIVSNNTAFIDKTKQ